MGSAQAACIGDCDGNLHVEIGEVVKGVNLVTGGTSVDACYRADPNCDGAVTVEELVGAVDGAANRCRHPVGPQYSFRIAEKVDFSSQHGEPQIMLHVRTTEVFECANYGIDGHAQIQDRAVKVSIGGILPPLLCLTAFAPAFLEMPLALTNGTYELELASSAGLDRYSVSVSDGVVQLHSELATFSQADDCVTPRVPRFAIAVRCFRYHYGGEGQVDELCPLLFADVETIAQPIETNGVGVGGYCGSSSLADDTCRLYRYPGDVQTLQQLVERSARYDLPHQYRTGDGQPLYYALIVTWLGHTLLLESPR